MPACFSCFRVWIVVLVVALSSLGGRTGLAQGAGGAASNLARLVHPEVADQLGLDDQQRATLQKLLQERAAIAAAAEDPEQKNKLASLDQKVRETLSDEQWKKWQSTPAENRLTFQFRDQKWDDVLQWFAQQEGVTLVMNQTPPGTFTYTDTRAYSPSEAIDLLNSVLLTRGYTLVRREKMLTLLQLSSTIPIELIPEVKLSELPSRGRFELIRVQFPLGGRPIDAVLKEVEPYLGPYGRALPLAQSRQLMVIENAGKMETINVLINTVPEPKAPPKPEPPVPPPAPVFASYPLGDLDPQAALETVKKLVASERITIDEKTRLLNAYVVPAEQTAIQSVLEQMQAKLTEMEPVNVVAYKLDETAEEGLIEQLQTLAPQAKITADAAAQRLIVTASPSQHTVVATALEALGIRPATAAPDSMSVQSFQLKGAEATTVGMALQTMLPDALVLSNPTLGTVVVRGTDQEIATSQSVIERWRGAEQQMQPILHAFPLPRPAPATWLPSVTKVVPGAEVWIDAAENQLMFLGTEEERSQLEKALPQLLTLIPAEPQRVLKTYRLSPEELSRWQPLQTTLQSEIPTAQMIVSTTDANGETELWVWAEEEDQKQIESLLVQVREAIPAEEIRWPRIYSFEKRDPTIIQKWIAERFPQATVEPRIEKDSFTVWASEATHADLESALPTLREQLPEPAEKVWKSYSAGKITVTELQTLLTPMVSDAGGAVGAGGVRMTADASGKRLLIEATEETHTEIARFITTLTEPLPADEELILLAYTLTNADATAVKTLLEAAIPGITLVVDTNRNQFVATATLAQHGRIKGLLSEIDSDEAAPRKPELRTYQLKELTASTLVPTLTAMWPKMTFTVDTAGNRILATGNVLDHEALQRTIDRLNSASQDEGLRVETYEVPQGNLVTLPTVLAQIAPKALISTDTINRVVVVWASETDHQRIAKALEQLRKTAEGKNEVTVYAVPRGQGLALRTTLLTMFPGVSIAMDAAGNQITVLAPKEIQAQVAEVIAKSEQAAATTPGTVPKRYEVPAEMKVSVTSLLASRFPGATVLASPTEDTDGMLIAASEEEQAAIGELISQIVGQMKPTGEDRIVVYELQRVEPGAFQFALAGRIPEARLIGAASKTPIVLATEEEHQRVAELVTELEQAFQALRGRELKVYSVREDLFTQVTAAIPTVVPDATLVPGGSVVDRVVLIATEKDHAKFQTWLDDLSREIAEPAEKQSRVFPLKYADPSAAYLTLSRMLPKVSFAVDTVGKSVSAVVDPEDEKKIQEFLTQYDVQRESPLVTKTYALETAQAISVYRALAAMVPAAQVVPEATGNRLIVTANPQDQERIAQVIEEMDTTAGPEKTVRGYALSKASLTGVLSTLQTTFPGATIAADSTNGGVVVSASEEVHAEIAALIEELDKVFGESQSARQSRVFPLKYADPSAAYLTLSRMLPKVSFAVDTVGKSVSAVVDPEDEKKIQEFLTQYDVQRESPLVTKTYALETAQAISVYRALAAMVPAAQVVPEAAGNRLIVTANPQDQERIAQVITEMDTTAGPEKTVRGYALKNASVTGVLSTLQTTFPGATIAADSANGGVVVSASDEVHTEIAELIEELDSVFGASRGMETRVFPLKYAPATSALLILQRMLPRSTVAGDTTSKTVAVTGSREDIAKAEKFVSEFDIERDALQETQTFALKKTTATSVARALAVMVPEGSVIPESTSNQVIVTAPKEKMERIAAVIQQIDANETEAKVIRSYGVETGGLTGLQSALQSTFPQATVAADSVSGIVMVAASEEEHEQIRILVDELNAAPVREPQLQVYHLAYADPLVVAEAVDDAFGWRSGVGVSADENSGSVFVLALPRQHEVARQVIEQMDREDTAVSKRKLRKYSIGGIDGSEVAEAVETLFENARPEVDVRYDFINEQLVVVGGESQLELVEETLKQFEPPARQLEIFSLRENDPERAEDAIEALFTDVAYSELPSITVDQDRQQLFIRATAEQLEEIRELLTRLGEDVDTERPQAVRRGGSAARLRTVNVGRASDELLQRLIEAWPQMRGNPLRVMAIEADGEPRSEAASEPNADGRLKPRSDSNSDRGNPDRGNPAQQDLGARNPVVPEVGGPILVSTSVQEPAVVQESERSEAGTGLVGVGTVDSGGSDQPAVVVIPGVGRWTIVSADVEALDAIQAWLEAIVTPPIEAAVTSGNHAVYVLQHADATDLEDVLSGLFRRSERSSISRLRTSTQIVADRRTNSLIVSGSRADRSVIEELLSVLDSPEMIDALEAAKPELIPVRNVDVDDVEDLLRTVYSAQLSSGGARRQITIPEGISEEVATMLRQLNAATRGPLLTLSVDSASNSVVIRAPAELSEEIREFIHQVDERAVSDAAARIRIIPLQGGNARQIGEVLENFRGGRRRSR